MSTKKSPEKFYKVPPLTDAVVVAHLWILHGWKVLPCQPGKKILIQDFGPYKQNVEKAEDIEFWFRLRKCNLAVVAPDKGIILDFDSAELYKRFCNESPEASRTYTESTPRGGFHVFMVVDRKIIFDPVPGLEIKKFAVVSPSVVKGRKYQVVHGKIELVDLEKALQGFGVTISSGRPENVPLKPAQGQIGGIFGLIDQAKAAWPILNFLLFFSPGLKLSGAGRWRSGLCPWHDDRSPSLWVDTERNTWGCHGCGEHGDVINWRALQKNWTMAEAAQNLIEYSKIVKVNDV